MARTETVTVAFTDLVGSTELSSRLGHDEYELLRRSHFGGLRLAIAKHGGSEIKTTGDGLMVSFVSTADALACAIAIQQSPEILSGPDGEAPLRIRIGVSSGEATREGVDLYGPPVVEASRLCAAASGGQILVSDVVRGLTRGKSYRFNAVGELTLKGLTHPVAAFEVVWEPLSKPAVAVIALLARTGEFWTIGYSGKTFSLKDLKGLSYIQRLLQHPGEEFHALDLLSGPTSVSSANRGDQSSPIIEGTHRVGALGDAGEALDRQAKQEYRRRLVELEETLADLKKRGDVNQAAEAESEIDFLKREIVRAVGLGGRDRRVGSAAERARLNVTSAIKGAARKISEHDSELGRLLDRVIRTGSFCSYVPDRRVSMSWRFSLEESSAPIDVESTGPLLLKGNTGFLRGLADRTTFVGRTEEYAALGRFLDQVAAGEGRVVILVGPLGVGKTRMATEISTLALDRGFLTLAGNCYDRVDVPFIPVVEILDDALARSSTPDVFRRALGADAAEVARLVPQLRRVFPDIPPPSPTTPEQSRRVLFNAVATLLARTADAGPVLLLVEDLHWADEGTLALLSHIARSIRGLPVMLLGTLRDYQLDSAGPLAQTLDECTRLHLLERVNLRGLSPSSVSDLIRTLSGQEPPASLVDAIYSRTDGNPFFVEELFKHIKEQGRLFDASGKFRASFKAEDLEVPPSARLVIRRRLARLNDATVKILGTAAVIGRSFTFALFEASCGGDADLLLDSLEEAEAAGVISSSLEQREALFRFSHELIREVVLTELSVPRRQRLHLRIADAIERIYAGSLEDKVSDLAYHLLHSGSFAEAPRTVECLATAAKQAVTQSAYESALSHLSNALERIREFGPGAARDERELALYLEYLKVVRLTTRWTTSESGAIYARARELCERSGQSSKMYEVLRGSANFHLGRGELDLAQDYGERILEISHSTSQPELVSSANYTLGHVFCLKGDLVSAHTHLEAIQPRDGMAVPVAGRQAKIFALGIDGMVLWMLGYPDRGLASAEQGVREAENSKNPFAVGFAHAQLHIVVFFRREFSRALELAELAVRHAADKQLDWLQKSGTWSMEACRVLARAPDASIDRTRRAFDAYFESEAKLYQPINCTYLAECYGMVGQTEAGISMVEQAFAAMEETNERMSEPETWRVKAGLLLRLAGSEAIGSDRVRSLREEGETCLRTAIQKAQIQASKNWELRAAVDLGRLLKGSERQAEAISVVRTPYDWFTEGFNTPIVVQARTLLEELSA